MRHKLSKNKLSRSSSQRKALLRNLVSDTIRHGKITTTKARAKEARPILEKMITIAKTKDFNSIRKVSEFITDKAVIDELFDNERGVLIMAENPEIRNNRLNLLGLVRNYSLKIADFTLLNS